MLDMVVPGEGLGEIEPEELGTDEEVEMIKVPVRLLL